MDIPKERVSPLEQSYSVSVSETAATKTFDFSECSDWCRIFSVSRFEFVFPDDVLCLVEHETFESSHPISQKQCTHITARITFVEQLWIERAVVQVLVIHAAEVRVVVVDGEHGRVELSCGGVVGSVRPRLARLELKFVCWTEGDESVRKYLKWTA